MGNTNKYIILNRIPPGGFGNKLFTYNFAFQLATKTGKKVSYIEDEDLNIFKLKMQNHYKKNFFISKKINLEKINKIQQENLKEVLESKNLKIKYPVLGESFFQISFEDPKKLFVIEPINSFNDTCAVHFRGGDFFTWNSNAILKTEYYINAIEKIIPQGEIEIFSDDWSLDSIKEFENYLTQKKYKFRRNNNTDFKKAFAEMASCESIISCPSTFGIWAGILGKSKRIIHSKKWINQRVEYGDKFWVDLRNGGNKYYSSEEV